MSTWYFFAYLFYFSFFVVIFVLFFPDFFLDEDKGSKNSLLPFQGLLIDDNSLSIHHRSLQKLVTETSKVKNGISTESMNVSEFIGKPYSLWTISYFISRRIRTLKYGTETPSYLGLKLWNFVPNEYQTIKSLADFKVKIKSIYLSIYLSI